ncbi:ubiquitin-specific protease ubp2 [Mortierella sp. AM989]|nr:ubiquitin-specific protease ubp2 [Mortierella sp. AM989]
MATPASDYWPSPTNVDDIGPLINALSLSERGTTPQRWIVDMSSHEIGLNPHPHIFYINPNECPNNSDSFNMSCQTCFKQYDVNISSNGACTSLSHHLHTQFSDESVFAICCHCGTAINALLEQPTIPLSLIYRIRMARKPKTLNPNAPDFHEAVATLIRILKNAAETGSDSINLASMTFINKIGLDESSKEFFETAGFSLIDQRFHPPDRTSGNVQLLNRCCFQLQLLLLQERPSLLTDLINPACQYIVQKLGCSTYERDAKEKIVDLFNKTTLMNELQSPLGKLGCVTDMSDDIIIDTFQTQVSHDVTTSHALVDVLVDIQKKRMSEKLDIEIACRKSEGIVTTAELRSAYMAFDIPNFGDGISNDVLLGLMRASHGSASAEQLKIIAKARNDSFINQLLEEPLEETMMEDPILDLYYAQNPVGLSNIGNTCYLNSLLQYIYTIKEIRETVMNMEAYVEDESAEGWKGKVIDGRILSQQDVAEAKETVMELRGLFSLMESAKSRSIAPSSRLVELLLSTGKDELTNIKTQRLPNESFVQQDVSETMSILMYRLNAAFQPTLSGQDSKPVDRFNRKAIEVDNSTGKRFERLIPEDFSTLILSVKEPITLEELIDDYFDALEPEIEGHSSDPNATNVNNTETSNNDNQKTITELQGRDITVTELPPILQIHLMRAQFDRKGNTSYKSNATVTIPKRIYMDQYLESDQEENADRIKRMKMWKKERRECRRTLESINQNLERLKEDHPDANETREPNGEVSDNPSNNIEPALTDIVNHGSYSAINPDFNNKESEQLSKISDLTSKLSSETADLNRAEYKIHAVFHHEGGADFGHYWVYIFDESSDEPRWIKYSDDFVSEVGIAQESEVFNGFQGSTACFCVYVRSNSDVVQTVWRSIS